MRTETAYITDDGLAFTDFRKARRHEACLNGTPHECPVCRGDGTEIVSTPIDYGDLTIFQHYPITHSQETVTCRTCDGRPYRQKPWRVVTEVKTLGYKNQS